MPEPYTRPPLVAREPGSRRFAVWRFRLVLLIGLAVLLVAAFEVFRALSGATAQDPDVTGALATLLR